MDVRDRLVRPQQHRALRQIHGLEMRTQPLDIRGFERGENLVGEGRPRR
jgi:hypothetical protein